MKTAISLTALRFANVKIPRAVIPSNHNASGRICFDRQRENSLYFDSKKEIPSLLSKTISPQSLRKRREININR